MRRHKLLPVEIRSTHPKRSDLRHPMYSLLRRMNEVEVPSTGTITAQKALELFEVTNERLQKRDRGGPTIPIPACIRKDLKRQRIAQLLSGGD